MKRLLFINMAMFIVLLILSCGKETPEGTLEPTEETPVPKDGTVILKPVLNTVPEETLVYFLIDNSNSVKRECGELDGRRFDFVNFMLNILSSISEPFSQSLYIGAGSFGNEANNFMSLISPRVASLSFSEVEKPSDTGDYQNYSDAIQRAVGDINAQPAQKRYLFILTDGEFSSEEVNDVQKKFGDITANRDLSVLIGLICSDDPDLYEDVNLWRNNINQINGPVHVFNTVEEAGRQLLENLNPFFPHSIAKSPENYQVPIIIHGGYTSSYFRYWNGDPNNRVLNYITDTTSGKNWGVSEIPHLQPIDPVIDRCTEHNLSMPNQGNRWLLFIQPQLFQELRLILTTDIGKPLELVNNTALIFNGQINDNSSEYNLQDWKDCFLIDLIKPNGDLQNGFVTPISYDGINYMQPDDVSENLLYGNVQWIPPQFTSPGEVEIKFNFRAKDGSGPSWAGVYDLPIKFEAIFSPPNSTPFGDNEGDTIQKNMTFSSVASEPKIYLVSDLNQDELINERNQYQEENKDDDRKYQNLTHIIGNEEAVELAFSRECTLSADILAEVYVCIIYDAYNVPLSYTYKFEIFKYIIDYYHFNRLFFIWEENSGTKAKAWVCDIEPNIVECNDNIPMPIIVKK